MSSQDKEGKKEGESKGKGAGELISKRLTQYIQQSGSRMFNDVNFLTENHVPEEFPHREDEIKAILHTLSAPLDGMPPEHIHAYGPPGTGKSHISRRAVEELNKRASKTGRRDIRYVLVSCNNKTLPKVYASLLANLGMDNVPSRGISVDDQMDRVKQEIDGMTVTIIFDEIDKMIPSQPYYKPQDTLISHFTRIMDENPANFDGNVAVMVISNNPRVTDDIDASTRSTFSPQKVFFRAYNAPEVSDILLKRCRQGFRDGVIDDRVVKRFGAVVHQSSRDLRTAFKVLRQAGRQVGMNGGETVTFNHLEEALNEVEKDIISDMLSNFNETQLALVLAVALAYEKSAREDGEKGAMSDDVYKHYKKIAEKFGLRILSRRHIMEHVVPRLEVQGLFTKSLHGRGRGQGVSAYFSIDEKDQEQLHNECIQQLQRKCPS